MMIIQASVEAQIRREDCASVKLIDKSVCVCTQNLLGSDDADQKRRNMIAALEDLVQRSKVEEGIEGQREHFDDVSKVTHISSDFKVRHSNGPNFWAISWSCILATFMELASRLHMPRTIRPSL